MSVPSSVVAWSDHKAFLLHGVRDLFESGKYSDLEIKCYDKSFYVHKLVLGLFTDYFYNYDGLWMRINVKKDHMENVLRFIYLGQVVIQYDQMEGFLNTCKFLGIKLFKDKELNAEGIAEADETSNSYQERYELNDFQLLCRKCYKCFPDEKSVKKHTWACLRPRNFKCKYCDKCFRHKNDIENHERLHTGERPFKCPREGCNKDFSLKSTMKLHVRVDHDKVGFPCKQCDKTFRTPLQLRYHRGVAHATDKPYACTDCGKCFAMRDMLRTHEQTAHASKQTRQRRYVKMRENQKKRAAKKEESTQEVDVGVTEVDDKKE